MTPRLEQFDYVPGLNTLLQQYRNNLKVIMKTGLTNCTDVVSSLGLGTLREADDADYFGHHLRGRIEGVMRAMRFAQVLGNSGMTRDRLSEVLGGEVDAHWGPEAYTFNSGETKTYIV